uniref:Uncharacterized protein n=1 Tax=Tanacetum cinerariifolium TaxID=118510 RepID=A0A6L2KZ46_TANCI|nr:hypothetical protein [Tanacetum cinerariifolium]
MLPIELTNEDIKNSTAYKEYYVIASGAAPPKTKASVRKTQSTTKRSLQQTHISKASGSGVDEGTGIIPEVLNVPTDEFDEEISWKSSDEDDDDDVDEQSKANDDDDQESDNDDDDFVHPKLSTYDEEAKDEETFDPIVQTPSQVENSNNESNNDESHGMNVGGDEGPNAKDDDEELYRDVNMNLEGRGVQMTDVYTTQVLEDTHVTLTLVNPDGQQQSSSVSSQFVTSMFNPSPDAGIDSLFESTPRVDVLLTTTVVPLPMTAPTLHPPSIPIMSQVQQAPALTPTTTLTENEDFLNKLDENIQKIIKEQVKVHVSKILPKIEKTVNEHLEAKVLTRSSNSSKTSYVVAADLSELELIKILIEKMESNKFTLKRRCDDADKDEEPSAGSDRGSKKSREGKKPKSTSAPKEKASKTTGAADDQPIAEASQHPEWFQKQTKPPTLDPFLMNRLKVDTLTPELQAGPTYELMKGSCKSLVELELFLEEVYKVTTNQLDWNNPEGQQYPHNLLKPLPLITNSRGRRVIPFDHFINNDLEYLRGGLLNLSFPSHT